MSLSLAVDTNVFLMANQEPGCAEVFMRICYCPDYGLLVDEEGKILAEYKQQARLNRGSRLAKLMERIIENRESISESSVLPVPVVLPLQVNLTKSESATLQNNNCLEPIHPQLLALTCKASSSVRLVLPPLVGVSEYPIQRSFYSQEILDSLCAVFSNVQVETSDEINWLKEPGDPTPHDQATLESFLNKHKLDANSIEREYIEAKCPESTENGIGRNLRAGIMRAICAMTNSRTGYIFVGVRDDGTIQGVPLKYSGRDVSSWDNLWGKFTAEFGQFKPHKPVVNQWFINLDNVEQDLRVIVIKVHKQDTMEFSYKNDVYVRAGTSSPKKRSI